MRPAKTSIVVFASSQFSTLVGFIATFYIASYLGPNVLGAYSVIVGMLYWISQPASAINSAINKRVSEGVDRGEMLSAGILTNVAITLFVVVGILLFSSSVEAYVEHPVSIAIAVLVFFWFSASFMSSALKGQKKVASSSIIWTTGRVARTSFQIGLTLLLGLGVSGLVWGHSISFFVATVLALVVNSVRPAWPSKHHFLSLLKYAKYSWLGQISVQAFNWLDTVLMAFFVSTTLIGIYEAAWMMASTLAVVSSAIGTTLFPTFSELSAQDRYEEVSELLTEGLTFAGIFIIPGLIGALTVGSRVLEIYGPEYGQGGLVLVLLVVARLTNAYSGLFKNTINAIDRPDIGFRINAALLLSNVVLNLVLIPIFGWVGAAVGTATSGVVALLIGYRWVGQVISIIIPYREIGLQIVASLFMVPVVVILSQTLGRGRVWTVLIVFLAAAVYSAALLGLSSAVRQKTTSILSEHPYLYSFLN